MRNWMMLMCVTAAMAGAYWFGQHQVGPPVVQTVAATSHPTGQAHVADLAVAQVVAEGRIAAYPGQAVVVASENGGIISLMRVHERDHVKKGALIAELRHADLLAAREEALARIREADADLRLGHVEHQRTTDLVHRQFISKQALDRTEHDLVAAEARRTSAEAALRRIEAEISKTRIIAPIDGTVLVRHREAGESVSPGGPVVTLANLSQLRVEAEVDEFDIGRLHVGDSVLIRAEGFEGRVWQGKVEELPDVVRERGLRPQDISRPTDARILLVKIALPASELPLKLGQRVEVTITPSRAG